MSTLRRFCPLRLLSQFFREKVRAFGSDVIGRIAMTHSVTGLYIQGIFKVIIGGMGNHPHTDFCDADGVGGGADCTG